MLVNLGVELEVETFKEANGSWKSGNYVKSKAPPTGLVKGKFPFSLIANISSLAYLHNLFYVPHSLAFDLYTHILATVVPVRGKLVFGTSKLVS